VTDAALAAAAPRPRENVLDIGCGTCTATLRQAEGWGQPAACSALTYLNSSWDLLASALPPRRRQCGACAGRRRDMRPSGRTFDLGFTRFGVMFFADPVAALRNIRRSAATRSAGRNPESRAWRL
jgi:ubiquinone/menaquinone biosynthesis C-methylase UbiE